MRSLEKDDGTLDCSRCGGGHFFLEKETISSFLKSAEECRGELPASFFRAPVTLL
jgi:hypothetical protein